MLTVKVAIEITRNYYKEILKVCRSPPTFFIRADSGGLAPEADSGGKFRRTRPELL